MSQDDFEITKAEFEARLHETAKAHEAAGYNGAAGYLLGHAAELFKVGSDDIAKALREHARELNKRGDEIYHAMDVQRQARQAGR